MKCRFIGFKAFSKSIFKIPFSLGWRLSIKQRKTREASSAHLLVPTPICRFPYLAWRDSKSWYPAIFADNWRKVLPTAIGRSPPPGFFSAISFAPKKYSRSSKGTFPSRITFTKFVKALWNSVRFARSIWQSNLSKFGAKCYPTLHKSRWRRTWEPWRQKVPRLRNNRYLWGPEQNKFPLRMFQLEGSVVGDCQICNLVVAYCHSDSSLNITFV